MSSFSHPGMARGTLAQNIFAGNTTLGPSTAIQGLGDAYDSINEAWKQFSDPGDSADPAADDSYTGSGTVGPGTLTQDPSLTCSQQKGTWDAATATCKKASGGGGGYVAPKPPVTPAPAAATGFSLDSVTGDPMMLGGLAVAALVGFVLYRKHQKKTRGY